jgi:ribosomal protein L44E
MDSYCRNDGQIRELKSVQDCKPDKEVRLWFECSKCHSGVTFTIPYLKAGEKS